MIRSWKVTVLFSEHAEEVDSQWWLFVKPAEGVGDLDPAEYD